MLSRHEGRSLVRWTADDRSLLINDTPAAFYILPRRRFSDAEVERSEGRLSAAGMPHGSRAAARRTAAESFILR